MRFTVLAALSLAGCASAPVRAPSTRPAAPDRMHAYYFGNSLIENSMPPFHGDLGKSAGKDWSCVALIEGGAALYNVFDKLERDDRFYAGHARSLLEGEPWDAIVLQPAKWIGLRRMSSKSGEPVEGPDRDIGDLASASGIIDRFLSGHPGGKVFIYQEWSGIKAKVDANGQPVKIGVKRVADKEGFDYETHWLEKYDVDAGPRGDTFMTRDYKQRFMEALVEKYPRLHAEKKLAMIPAGDVFFALNRKLRAGAIAGLTDIEDFYTDWVHIRGGLPRYTVAATFFAVLFGEPPDNLDWKIFNDPEKYRTTPQDPDPRKRLYIHAPDLGEHLPITEEAVRVVNETIWEVVAKHPHTGR